ncbi:MAG: putative oxidoreductase YjmC [Firmicutes bacterium ADurb.Bin182]|nr:MAG: putative oxidoreductase YjmC [Firmicutes bacterium ADurb.Bin182]
MKFDYYELLDVASQILIACGEEKTNAYVAAKSMVKADARGITTHGTYLLTPIYKRIQVNQLSLPTKATVVKDSGATAIVDGGDGLGAIAGQLALEIATEKAKTYGLSSVLIRNTNNVGSLAFYTEQAAKEGLIAIMSCNAAPAIAPWGGAEAFMGTNPVAISFYTGKELIFTLDMASSVVARGKIRKAERNREPIPDNWALDENGNPTTDPAAALKGTLLPIGGPKGSALALAVDILSGILPGGSHAPNLKSFHSPEGSTGVGASLILLSIERFLNIGEYVNTMEDYIASIKKVKKAKGFEEILIPGELEYRRELDSMKYGIELDNDAIDAINNLLKKTGSGIRLGE